VALSADRTALSAASPRQAVYLLGTAAMLSRVFPAGVPDPAVARHCTGRAASLCRALAGTGVSGRQRPQAGPLWRALPEQVPAGAVEVGSEQRGLGLLVPFDEAALFQVGQFLHQTRDAAA
jgi:hypothetical protein